MGTTLSYTSSKAAEQASGSSFTAAGAKAFTPPSSHKWFKCAVFNKGTSGANLYILWNDDPDSPAVDPTNGNWDVELAPGKMVTSPDGIQVTNVGIYADAAATYGDDFVVRGWSDGTNE